jgi:hypothetical protein
VHQHATEKTRAICAKDKNDLQAELMLALPVDKVPLPNSSSRIRDRDVQFRKAKETWFKSIMNAD